MRLTAGLCCTFVVLCLNEDFKDPRDGRLLVSKTVDYPYGGYHRVYLDQPIYVQAGSTLSIVVTSLTGDGKYEIVMDQMTSNLGRTIMSVLSGDPGYYGVGVINPGESYLYASKDGTGTWEDWSKVVDGATAEAEAVYEKAKIADHIKPVVEAREKYMDKCNGFMSFLIDQAQEHYKERYGKAPPSNAAPGTATPGNASKDDDFSINNAFSSMTADGTFAAGTYATDAQGRPIYDADGNPVEIPAWEMVNGHWFAFGVDSYAKSGWIYDPFYAGWFYIDIDAGMKTGWQPVDGVWYYFKTLSDGTKGIMYADTTTPDGYHVNADGSWDGKPAS